ncbi:hypothetical protein THAOC_24783, partial [Thalassiosira oceanica]
MLGTDVAGGDPARPKSGREEEAGTPPVRLSAPPQPLRPRAGTRRVVRTGLLVGPRRRRRGRLGRAPRPVAAVPSRRPGLAGRARGLPEGAGGGRVRDGRLRRSRAPPVRPARVLVGRAGRPVEAARGEAHLGAGEGFVREVVRRVRLVRRDAPRTRRGPDAELAAVRRRPPGGPERFVLWSFAPLPLSSRAGCRFDAHHVSSPFWAPAVYGLTMDPVPNSCNSILIHKPDEEELAGIVGRKEDVPPETCGRFLTRPAVRVAESAARGQWGSAAFVDQLVPENSAVHAKLDALGVPPLPPPGPVPGSPGPARGAAAPLGVDAEAGRARGDGV